jgi:hypothetical protein
MEKETRNDNINKDQKQVKEQVKESESFELKGEVFEQISTRFTRLHVLDKEVAELRRKLALKKSEEEFIRNQMWDIIFDNTPFEKEDEVNFRIKIEKKVEQEKEEIVKIFIIKEDMTSELKRVSAEAKRVGKMLGLSEDLQKRGIRETLKEAFK